MKIQKRDIPGQGGQEPGRSSSFAPGRLLLRSLGAFVVALAICLALVTSTIRYKTHVASLEMERLLVETSMAVTERISMLMRKAYVLEVLVRQHNGDIDWFDALAPTLVDDPAILNVLVAPGGVVRKIYPPKAGEALVGFDLLAANFEGNKEAEFSKEKGELVFAGPFNLSQGGQGLVGRQPVMLPAPGQESGGAPVFWGLVTVALSYPEALQDTGLTGLERKGYGFELWRINPDSGEHQVIAGRPLEGTCGFIEHQINLFNANWHLRICNNALWYTDGANWLLLAASLCVSLLIAFLVMQNQKLRAAKVRLRGMVLTDPLTGVLNRKGLYALLDGFTAEGTPCRVSFLDMNYFKHINDMFGHHAGDVALVEFARRMGRSMTAGHTLARVGGDEFILVEQVDLCPEHEPFWAQVEKDFAQPLFTHEGQDVYMSFSRGTALFPEDGTTAEALVSCADQRMYENKNKRYAAEHTRRRTDNPPGP